MASQTWTCESNILLPWTIKQEQGQSSLHRVPVLTAIILQEVVKHPPTPGDPLACKKGKQQQEKLLLFVDWKRLSLYFLAVNRTFFLFVLLLLLWYLCKDKLIYTLPSQQLYTACTKSFCKIACTMCKITPRSEVRGLKPESQFWLFVTLFAVSVFPHKHTAFLCLKLV